MEHQLYKGPCGPARRPGRAPDPGPLHLPRRGQRGRLLLAGDLRPAHLLGLPQGELAVQALEEIAFHLGECTAEEKKALAEVLAEMRANELETGPRPDVLAFLDSFLVSFGLADEAEAPEPTPPPRINLL